MLQLDQTNSFLASCYYIYICSFHLGKSVYACTSNIIWQLHSWLSPLHIICGFGTTLYLKVMLSIIRESIQKLCISHSPLGHLLHHHKYINQLSSSFRCCSFLLYGSLFLMLLGPSHLQSSSPHFEGKDGKWHGPRPLYNKISRVKYYFSL